MITRIGNKDFVPGTNGQTFGPIQFSWLSPGASKHDLSFRAVTRESLHSVHQGVFANEDLTARIDGNRSRLLAGASLPMLLRAVTYRREPLDILVARAMAGGTQGVMQIATAAPQNQARKKNDQDDNDHQQ